MLQVVAPPRWIIACAQLPHRRPTQYGLHPATHPACCFRYLAPNGLKHLQHERQINLSDGQLAEDGEDVAREAIIPLCCRRLRPPGLMTRDVITSALFKRTIASFPQHLLGSLLPLERQRVIAREQRQPRLAAVGARCSETD